ncbi:MAG: GNAT family N-acetyltransferase [Actinomycetota bacterium]
MDESSTPNDLIVRFQAGFAARTGLDQEVLAEPGVSLLPRPDRAGSNAVFCYQVDRHRVLWCDPAVADQIETLVGEMTEAADERWLHIPAGHGFQVMGANLMRVGAVRPWPGTGPTAPSPYLDRRLDAAHADTLPLVRTLTEVCDPQEVEDAALDELDEFDELAINVLTAEQGDGSRPLLAYASAAPWEWDEAFADIGVLVHPEHRRRGLGHHVVARTVADLFDGGRLPLYRHDPANRGSAAIADGLGFVEAARIVAYTATDRGG